MSLHIRRAGLMTTVQARPRTGQRHLGVPLSGPADPLSMALANHLVGNGAFAPALETTLSGVDLDFEVPACFAIAGAPADSTLNGEALEAHQSYAAKAGDRLCIGAATSGVRTYVAVGGGVAADEFLGSASSYVPAGFGGFKGRALEDGDQLALVNSKAKFRSLRTPDEFRPPVSSALAMRACTARDFKSLQASDQQALFDTNFTVGVRSDRMGIKLEGREFEVAAAGYLDSVPIFPGCVQCPPDGSPYLLGVDAQTTGGYAQLAQVARVDRHLLGQLRAGNHLRLLRRSPEQAAADLREKHEYWRGWLDDIEGVV